MRYAKSKVEGPAWLAAAMDTVGRAAEAFEGRWTLRALKRVDEKLHELFTEQEEDYGQALIVGDQGAVEEQAGAMVRAYVAVTQRMVEAQEPDDVYLLGLDAHTGTRVAIGDQQHARARVRELHGDAVIWFTPDEVAAMVAGLEAIKRAKAVWPDAEVIQIREGA